MKDCYFHTCKKELENISKWNNKFVPPHSTILMDTASPQYAYIFLFLIPAAPQTFLNCKQYDKY